MTAQPKALDRRLSVAPMMDRTDRHCRYFLRTISARTLLYTEMIPTGAVLQGDRARHLAHDAAEAPLALQLGGADPDALAQCARIAEAAGYAEVNLNVGCPSDRVQNARFGACLMAEPATVAAAVRAMIAATALPVTVKCRTGIDDRDSYGELKDFIKRVADAGTRSFAVHARKAWLAGLSPKANREIPPLDYDRVYALKAEFPALEIVVNGGIASLDAAEEHLHHVDGVMIGRAAYQDPYMLAAADARIFGGDGEPPARAGIVVAMRPYIAEQLARGVPLARIARHMLGLYAGVPGARAWRRHLSVQASRPGAGLGVLDEARMLAEDGAGRDREAA